MTREPTHHNRAHHPGPPPQSDTTRGSGVAAGGRRRRRWRLRALALLLVSCSSVLPCPPRAGLCRRSARIISLLAAVITAIARARCELATSGPRTDMGGTPRVGTLGSGFGFLRCRGTLFEGPAFRGPTAANDTLVFWGGPAQYSARRPTPDTRIQQAR